MTEYQGVAVYCELKAGGLLPISAEGLGVGRRLADALGQPLSAMVLGNEAAGVAQQAIAAGADKVYTVGSPALQDYQAETYLIALEKVVNEARPRVLILGQTDAGRELAPRLAFRLGTTATLDCVNLAIDGESKRLLQTKPVYGGNAQAVYSGDTDPQIVTIRTKAFEALETDASRRGEVIEIGAPDFSGARTKVVERVVEEAGGIKLEDAAVVVSGGRGMGGQEGFGQLHELAKVLKAAVGASRPACDNGWIADTMQVGLTGKIIAPDLYIAVAISGSSQHMSGCSGSKMIIAINKDKEANIFRHARFGVVGDWKKVLPAFTAKIKELLG